MTARYNESRHCIIIYNLDGTVHPSVSSIINCQDMRQTMLDAATQNNSNTLGGIIENHKPSYKLKSKPGRRISG